MGTVKRFHIGMVSNMLDLYSTYAPVNINAVPIPFWKHACCLDALLNVT